MSKHMFKDYKSRLTKEAVIKALICGMIVGFSALFVSATVFWAIGFKHVWLCAIVWVVATAIAAPIFYAVKFRPTLKDIALRIDELGLEERILTMTELEGDDSYIAIKQRSDALSALETVNAKLIAIAVSVPLIVAVSVSAVFGLGMTTVSALSATGVIKSGQELIEDATKEPEKQYEVTYEVMGEGMIEGDEFQIVKEGENATGVMAVADDEWAFVMWSDGSQSPYREDTKITKDMVIIAVFMQIEEGMDPMDGEDGEEGKGKPSDKGKPGDKPGEGDPSDNPQGGGQYEPANQVIDGETFYGGATYDNAYEQMMEELAQSEDIPDELKDIIVDYFETIEQ